MNIGIFILWNIFGSTALMIAIIVEEGGIGALGMAKGWEFVNPIHIYKYNRVNWFGAVLIALIYNALSPIGSICYWFYKLCTVGRK